MLWAGAGHVWPGHRELCPESLSGLVCIGAFSSARRGHDQRSAIITSITLGLSKGCAYADVMAVLQYDNACRCVWMSLLSGDESPKLSYIMDLAC